MTDPPATSRMKVNEAKERKECGKPLKIGGIPPLLFKKKEYIIA